MRRAVAPHAGGEGEHILPNSLATVQLLPGGQALHFIINDDHELI
jgi:hypothetical protein